MSTARGKSLYRMRTETSVDGGEYAVVYLYDAPKAYKSLSRFEAVVEDALEHAREQKNAVATRELQLVYDSVRDCTEAIAAAIDNDELHRLMDEVDERVERDRALLGMPF